MVQTIVQPGLRQRCPFDRNYLTSAHLPNRSEKYVLSLHSAGIISEHLTSDRMSGRDQTVNHGSTLFFSALCLVLFAGSVAICQLPETSPTPQIGNEKIMLAKRFIEQANNCDAKNTKCKLTAYTKAID